MGAKLLLLFGKNASENYWLMVNLLLRAWAKIEEDLMTSSGAKEVVLSQCYLQVGNVEACVDT